MNSRRVPGESADFTAEPDPRTTIDQRRSALALRPAHRDRAARRASAPRIPAAPSAPPLRESRRHPGSLPQNPRRARSLRSTTLPADRHSSASHPEKSPQPNALDTQNFPEPDLWPVSRDSEQADPTGRITSEWSVIRPGELRDEADTHLRSSQRL